MYRRLAGAAVCAAAFILTFGAAAGGVPTEPAAAEVSAETPASEPPGFVVRECAGSVCVFHADYDTVPVIVTEISVGGLPEADRRLLTDGIRVEGREELLRLLEDLGS